MMKTRYPKLPFSYDAVMTPEERARKICWNFGLWLMETAYLLHPKTKAITWRDHIAWKIDGIGSWIFSVFYSGSNSEVCDALNGELPFDCMDQRLRAIVDAEIRRVRNLPAEIRGVALMRRSA